MGLVKTRRLAVMQKHKLENVSMTPTINGSGYSYSPLLWIYGTI